ncbi:MAG: DUF255 domain-containing protein [Planctomycetota bacterium]
MLRTLRTLYLLVVTSLLATAFAPAAESAALPAWLVRSGTVRTTDPAVAKKGGVIRWRSWSADAFAEAERSKKLLFVFVTSNASHSAAEMERAVLSDIDIATRLNTDFVPVKLNREAFPETDVRLQQAVMAIKGLRGWPLTIFLTPDGEIVFGATSLPLNDDIELNKPGLRSIVSNLTTRWKEDADRISREAGSLSKALKKNTEQYSPRGTIPPGILNTTVLKFQALIDRENGGLRSPVPAQFPEPRALELCLAHYARTSDKQSLELVEITLDRMLRGGLYDHLEGGFHHFCVDRQWRVPRFEKMPLLNAEIITILLHTWQATGDGRYRTAAEDSLNFWRGDLDATGTFFPANIAPEARSFQDGDFYTWSLRDIELLFTDDTDIRFARSYFGIDESGNLPNTAPGQTVLSASRSVASVARELGLQLDAATKRLDRIRDTLRAARSLRPRPPRDETPLCDANAMLAAAFMEGGRLLGRDDLMRQGLKTLNAILNQHKEEGEVPRSVRHILNDPTSVPLAMDEAARAWACLHAYEATSNPTFMQLAVEALDRLDLNYRDLLRGGYIERSFKGPLDFAQALNWRTKSIQDTSEPATNGLIASTFVRLFALTSNPTYMERAKTAIENCATVFLNPSPYNSTLTAAADATQNGVLRIKVIGREGDAVTRAMLSLAHTRYFPWKTVMRFDTAEAAGEVTIANIDKKSAYAIVETQTDKLVAESLEELNTFLDDLGKRAPASVVPIK